MRQQLSPKLLGTFVLTSIVILIVALLAFSTKQIFQTTNKYLLFFSESLNGLNEGSAVKFNGVTIGKVVSINVNIYHENNDVKIPVVIQIEPNRFQEFGKRRLKGTALTKKLVQQGLRASLKMQSIVTGQLYVELNFLKDKPANYVKTDIDIPQIPTVPSELGAISDAIDAAKNAFNSADKILSSKDLEEGIAGFNKTMAEAEVTLEKYRKLAIELEGLTENVNVNVDPIAMKIDDTLDEFNDTMTSIRYLTDYLSRHPEALIKGKGKPKG